MFVFVFDAALFYFKQDAPHSAALGQLPPTSAAAPRKSVYFKPGSFYTTWLLLFLYGTRLSMRGWPPRVPAGGYAAGCSQERQAPKIALLTEAALFKFKQEAQQHAAESQTPPTRA